MQHFLNRLLDLDTKSEGSTSNQTSQNLSTSDPSVTSVLKRVKQIAQLFNQSPKISAELCKELKSRGCAERTLIQEVSTRWNSAYNMLERYESLADPICVVLAKAGRAELILNNKELLITPDIVKSLKPFMEVTKVMSQENVLTLSLIVPLVTTLIQNLGNMDMKTTSGQKFLRKQTEKQLLPYEETSIAR